MATTHAVVSASQPARRIPWRVILLLALWLALVVAAGAAGVFEAAPTRPPLPLLLAVVGPPLVVAVGIEHLRRSGPSPCRSTCAC